MAIATIYSSSGKTLSGKCFVLFCISEKINYRDIIFKETILLYTDTKEIYLFGGSTEQNITHLTNINEDEYFLISTSWDHNISIELVKKIVDIINENKIEDNSSLMIEY